MPSHSRRMKYSSYTGVRAACLGLRGQQSAILLIFFFFKVVVWLFLLRYTKYRFRTGCSASVKRKTWVFHLAVYCQFEQVPPQNKHPGRCCVCVLSTLSLALKTALETMALLNAQQHFTTVNEGPRQGRVRRQLRGRELTKRVEALGPISNCTKTPVWSIPLSSHTRKQALGCSQVRKLL